MVRLFLTFEAVFHRFASPPIFNPYLLVNSCVKNKTLNLKSDTGSATAEYAIATMAAVGFAGLLVIIMRSDEVKKLLYDLVLKALTLGSE